MDNSILNPEGWCFTLAQGWTISDDGTSATITSFIPEYKNCTTAFEIRYCNDWMTDETWIGTGIYVIYDDGTGGEEDKAQITGVSLVVDGVTYYDGTAIITPDTESVTIQVSGSNLQYATEDHYVWYALRALISPSETGWIFNDEGTVATKDLTAADMSSFMSCTTAFELCYSNESADTDNWIPTGVSVLFQSELVSVAITWGALAFTYTDSAAAWSCDEGANRVSVTNDSSVTVDVAIVYTSASGYEEITGSFGDLDSATLVKDDSTDFLLTLRGKPNRALSGDRIGTVTVTITESTSSGESDLPEVTGIAFSGDYVKLDEATNTYIITVPSDGSSVEPPVIVTGTNLDKIVDDDLDGYSFGIFACDDGRIIGSYPINNSYTYEDGSLSRLDGALPFHKMQVADYPCHIKVSNDGDNTFTDTGYDIALVVEGESSDSSDSSESDAPKVTGVALSGDNVKLEGNTYIVTVPSDGSAVLPTVIVTGTNLETLTTFSYDMCLIGLFNGTDYQEFFICEGTCNETFDTLTVTGTLALSYVATFDSPFDIKFSNDGGETYTDSGYDLKVVVEGETGESDAPEVTGVAFSGDSLTLDEATNTYIVTVPSDGSVVFPTVIVTGTNLDKILDDDLTNYYIGLFTCNEGDLIGEYSISDSYAYNEDGSLSTSNGGITFYKVDDIAKFYPCDIMVSSDGGNTYTDTEYDVNLVVEGDSVDSDAPKVTGVTLSGDSLTLDEAKKIYTLSVPSDWNQRYIDVTVTGNNLEILTTSNSTCRIGLFSGANCYANAIIHGGTYDETSDTLTVIGRLGLAYGSTYYSPFDIMISNDGGETYTDTEYDLKVVVEGSSEG